MGAAIGVLLDALPLLSASAAAALVAWARELIIERLKVSPKFFPLLLTLAGAVVAGVAQFAGVDIGDLNPETASLNRWQTVIAGAMTGLGTVGLYELQSQLRRDGPRSKL